MLVTPLGDLGHLRRIYGLDYLPRKSDWEDIALECLYGCEATGLYPSVRGFEIIATVYLF
jgi:hypothetical protein